MTASKAPDTTPKTLPKEGYIRLAQLLLFIPVSASTIWRWSKQGKFPASFKLSENITVWKAEQVREWLEKNEVSA